jgi:hypothetical protein
VQAVLNIHFRQHARKFLIKWVRVSSSRRPLFYRVSLVTRSNYCPIDQGTGVTTWVASSCENGVGRVGCDWQRRILIALDSEWVMPSQLQAISMLSPPYSDDVCSYVLFRTPFCPSRVKASSVCNHSPLAVPYNHTLGYLSLTKPISGSWNIGEQQHFRLYEYGMRFSAARRRCEPSIGHSKHHIYWYSFIQTNIYGIVSFCHPPQAQRFSIFAFSDGIQINRTIPKFVHCF